MRRTRWGEIAIGIALGASLVSLLLSTYYAVAVTTRLDETNRQTCLQRRTNVIASNTGTLFVLRAFLDSAVRARSATAIALRAGPQTASVIEQARLNEDAAASYRQLLHRLPKKYIVPTC